MRLIIKNLINLQTEKGQRENCILVERILVVFNINLRAMVIK